MVFLLAKELNKKLKNNENLLNDLNNKVKLLEKSSRSNEKVLDSYYNYFENIYLNHELVPIGVWAKLQLLEQELLTFVDNVCAKYDLEYWLDYGTLIGAVRHGGFVPWDDDVDIGMMRKDYEKIYLLLEKEIKENDLSDFLEVTRFHENRGVPGDITAFIQLVYWYPITHINMSNLDIFPYDFRESKEGIDENLYYKERDKYHSRVRNNENPIDITKDCRENLCFADFEADYIVPGVEAPRGINQYKFDIMEKEVIFPLKTIKFKDKYFKCPNDYENYLKRIYGDYTQIPKSIQNHNTIVILKAIDDIDQQQDFAINKIKSVNEKMSF